MLLVRGTLLGRGPWGAPFSPSAWPSWMRTKCRMRLGAGRGRGSDPGALWLPAAGVLGAGGQADMPAPQGPEALRLAVPSLRLAGAAPWRVPSQETVLPGCQSQGSRSEVWETEAACFGGGWHRTPHGGG